MYEDPHFDLAAPDAGGEPITKVCRKCSVQSVTDGGFCPQCGTPYVKRRRAPSRRLLIISCSVILLLAAAVAVLVWNSNRDDHQRRVAAAAASRSAAASSAAASQASVAAARSAAAEAASSSAAEKRQRDDAERAIRRLEIQDLEKNIKKDAVTAVNQGILDGPVLRADCTPVGGGSSDDLTAHTGRFSCIAVTEVNKSSGTESGYGYSAVINWDTGELTWHLGNS